jgi:hypothetical protein
MTAILKGHLMVVLGVWIVIAVLPKTRESLLGDRPVLGAQRLRVGLWRPAAPGAHASDILGRRATLITTSTPGPECGLPRGLPKVTADME